MLPYDETGSGRLVVLLHAGIANRTMWSGLRRRRAWSLRRSFKPGGMPRRQRSNAATLRLRIDAVVNAQALARALPRASHAVIKRARHLAPLETPELFRRLLLDFLG
jgi:hypothetical protein